MGLRRRKHLLLPSLGCPDFRSRAQERHRSDEQLEKLSNILDQERIPGDSSEIRSLSERRPVVDVPYPSPSGGYRFSNESVRAYFLGSSSESTQEKIGLRVLFFRTASATDGTRASNDDWRLNGHSISSDAVLLSIRQSRVRTNDTVQNACERRRGVHMQFTICLFACCIRSAFESTNEISLAGLCVRFLELICLRAFVPGNINFRVTESAPRKPLTLSFLMETIPPAFASHLANN